jgi:signal transduction histidine kinase
MLNEDVLEAQARLSSLGLLAAGTAHELANPLGVVKSGLEYIGKGLAKVRDDSGFSREARSELEEWGKIIAEMKEAVQRMLSITAELRLAVRHDSGIGECDVREVLEKALSLTHNMLKYKAKVEKEFRHSSSVFGDEARMLQVFINLLTNSAQAIPEHGIVRVETDEKDGFVVVRVADNGVGIKEEHIKRLFEPFFTTKPKGEGTGLGLFLVKKIVESFGGDIQIESKVGKGTVVMVRLRASAQH